MVESGNSVLVKNKESTVSLYVGLQCYNAWDLLLGLNYPPPLSMVAVLISGILSAHKLLQSVSVRHFLLHSFFR